MKLGILLNTSRNLEYVEGICRAALDKNHQVIIFAMDQGTSLLESRVLVSLAGLEGVSVSMCEHSASMLGVSTEGLSPLIVSGSQLQNAMMNHSADRVIVL